MSTSSPYSDAIQAETISVSRYVIDANELYDYPNTDPVEKLASCPMNSIIRVVESPNNDGSQYTFKLDMNESNYLSNGLKFKMTIPLTVTRKNEYKLKKVGDDYVEADDGTTTAIDETNFMHALFSNNADICLSQFSIYQAIASQMVSLNGNQISTTGHFSDVFNASSQYALTGDLAQWVQSSVPDRFQNFNDYKKNGAIKLRNIDGETMYTSYSPEQENNIFNSKYSPLYISRTPEWRWGKGAMIDAGESLYKTAHVIVDFEFYMALSIGSTPEGATSFAGVRDLEVSFTMKSGMAPYLFSLQKTAADRIASIVVDQSSVGINKAYMFAQIFTAPTYMIKERIDPQTNTLKPYSIAYDKIDSFTGTTYNVGPGVSTSFNYASITTSYTPSHAYISLVRTRKGTQEQIMTTPICYGLFKTLDITAGAATTSFHNPRALTLISDANGYDCMDPQGMASKGYTVKIDFTKDISMNGETLVGASGRFDLSVSGNFMNVGDTAADFQIQVHLVTPSQIQFDGSGFSTATGVMITDQMRNSQSFYRDAMAIHGRRVDVIGAGFFKNVARGAVNLAKKAWQNRDTIAKTIGDVVKTATLLKGGERSYSNTVGAGRNGALGAGNVGKTIFK